MLSAVLLPSLDGDDGPCYILWCIYSRTSLSSSHVQLFLEAIYWMKHKKLIKNFFFCNENIWRNLAPQAHNVETTSIQRQAYILKIIKLTLFQCCVPAGSTRVSCTSLNERRPTSVFGWRWWPVLHPMVYIQSNLVISNSLISNYRLSRSENLVPVLTRNYDNR